MTDPGLAVIIIRYEDGVAVLPAFVFLDETDVEAWLRSRDATQKGTRP